MSRKEDASPVTEADRAADRLIVAALETSRPSFPVVSEEGEKPEVGGAEHFWLVDPLDGTKSFIRGSGYFTVNIGLIENGVPVLGVVYDPVGDAMYCGSPEGAFRNGTHIHVRAAMEGRKAALISHSHINRATEDYLARRKASRSASRARARSNSALLPKAGPTFTRVSARRWNGTPPPGMPCSPPRAAKSPRRRESRFFTARMGS